MPVGADRLARRRRMVLAAIARRQWLLQMLALGAAGCHRRDDGAASRRSTVVIACPEGELQPDFNFLPSLLLFLPLVAYDHGGRLRGRLAERWEHTPDYREWTYHLRPNLRWHDGVPVTAHDVQFTLDLLTHPDVFAWGKDTFPSSTVIDDLTIRIATGHQGQLALNREIVHYPRHLLQDVPPKALSQSDFWKHPVGNGPYRFARAVPQTMMELEPNPDYYGGRPRIERVVLKFDGGGAAADLLAGDVDAVTVRGRSQFVRSLAADPRFRFYHWYRNERARAIYWQNDHPLFADARVRRALTLAINRRALLGIVEYPADLPIVDGPFTLGQLARRDLPEPLAYDPAAARALLDAAGWRQSGPGAVRERDQRPFRFSALVNASVGEDDPAIAVYMQHELRQIGIHMDIQSLEEGSLFQRLRARAFEAAIAQVWLGSYTQKWGSVDSPLGYRNPAVVALMDRLLVTADPEGVDNLHRELTTIFRADLPVTYLFPYVFTVIANRRVRGLSSPWRADPAGHMEDLWLDDRTDE